MKVFYCPKCGKYEEHFKFKSIKEEKHLTTWINPRDGYGMIIHHIICTNCGNVLSGIMNIREKSVDEWYIKETISMYNRERKDNGYIENGKLEWLINDIKNKKGIE